MAPRPQRLSDSHDDKREEGGGRPVASRFEVFAQLAEAWAAGEVVPLPRHLMGDDRRLHVRQTLREDHQFRIANRSEDAETKFDKLAGSLFSFFRGTSLLFYRDMAGEAARMPTVLALGDVHPENFDVMPNSDNVPIFAANDFDEAYFAPFPATAATERAEQDHEFFRADHTLGAFRSVDVVYR